MTECTFCHLPRGWQNILNGIMGACVAEGFELRNFLADEKTKRATSMTLINIGELVKNLTDEFKLNFNNIPFLKSELTKIIANDK